MTKNVCGIEKWIRAIAGIALVLLYVTDVLRGTLGIVLTIAGCVLIITAIGGYCPINRLLGLNSCRVKTPEKKLPVGVNQMYQNPQGNDGYVSQVPGKTD